MNTETQRNPLGYAPIPGLIRKFAIPSIVGMLVNAAYNITDQIFIGHIVGMLGNAATNVAFPMVMLTIAFSQMIGIGTASNFNLCLGAKEEEKARTFFCTGLTLLPLLGIFLMLVVLIFRDSILTLCGATEAVFPYARSYLSITAFGVPFLMFSGACNTLIRADGSPTYSMLCVASGAVLNVLLDALFMFVFDWGIQGAAAATVIGQVTSFACGVAYLPRLKTFKLRLRMLGLRGKYILQIFRLGLSNFINHVIMTVVNIVMNNVLTRYGALSIYGSDIPLAVSGVVAKLNNILSSFSIGLAMGCQPILGFNMGAKQYDRVKKTYKTALAASLVINVISLVLFQVFPRQVVSIFGSGSELYFEFAVQYMRIFMLLIFVHGVQPLSVNYFTGIGDMKRGILISLSRQGLFMIPSLLLLPMWLGLDGVLYAGPIADALACALALSLVFLNFKKLTRQQNALS